ncbi:MAG: hypothetical protein IH898_12675 [Planctomycetes bacterium]|nr:hypothetical protein [Planctomycetota bacterium]
MSVELDPSGEFAQWADGLENVTLRRRDSGETVAITVALRRDVVAQEAQPSGGAALQTDAVWHLQLPAGESPPELGDVVIDTSDHHWTIQQTEELPLLRRWKCAARELRVAFGCVDRVDVQRAVWDDLGSGPEIVGWSYVYTALPVKIQSEKTLVSDTSIAPTSTLHFHIILGEAFSLEPDDRFVAADGAIYRLESIEQADRIDVLPIAKVVRVSP